MSLTFDDGYDSTVSTALPILQKYGYKATEAVVVSFIGRKGFLNRDDLIKLRNAQWEIASHSMTHSDLTKMLIQSAEDEITGSQAALRGLNLGPINIIVPPNSAWNAQLRDFSVKYYKAAAVGTNTVNDIPLTDIYRVHRFTVTGSTTMESINALLDQAKTEHKWIVLEMHGVGSPASPYTIKPDTLTQIAESIKKRSLRVVTLSDGYDLALTSGNAH